MKPPNAGKTFGVISLVGDAQAREIETRLVRELGPEGMERRQIVCGYAYAFQGDERDVMFLSMVSAPSGGCSIPAMTDAAAPPRFNAAASRARDQLLLFHTATLADLNPQCVRYRLLEYCLNHSLSDGKWRQAGKRLYLSETNITGAENAGRAFESERSLGSGQFVLGPRWA